MLRSQKKEIKRDPAKYLTSLPRPLENHIWRMSAFNGGKNDYPSRLSGRFPASNNFSRRERHNLRRAGSITTARHAVG